VGGRSEQIKTRGRKIASEEGRIFSFLVLLDETFNGIFQKLG